jgi:hypothetical protein
MNNQQVIQKENELTPQQTNAKKNTRFMNGVLIATNKKIYHIKDSQKFWVQSQSEKTGGNHFYTVEITDQGLSCDCPDMAPNRVCKHEYALIHKMVNGGCP